MSRESGSAGPFVATAGATLSTLAPTVARVIGSTSISTDRVDLEIGVPSGSEPSKQLSLAFTGGVGSQTALADPDRARVKLTTDMALCQLLF